MGDEDGERAKKKTAVEVAEDIAVRLDKMHKGNTGWDLYVAVHNLDCQVLMDDEDAQRAILRLMRTPHVYVIASVDNVKWRGWWPVIADEGMPEYVTKVIHTRRELIDETWQDIALKNAKKMAQETDGYIASLRNVVAVMTRRSQDVLHCFLQELAKRSTLVIPENDFFEVAKVKCCVMDVRAMRNIIEEARIHKMIVEKKDARGKTYTVPVSLPTVRAILQNWHDMVGEAGLG